MKTISSRQSSKKRLVLLGVVLISLVSFICVGLYFSYDTKNSTTGANTDKDTSGRADEIKRNAPKRSTASSGGLSNDTTNKTTDQVPTDSTLSVTINSTTQSNGQVQATAKTSTNGTCVFQYTTEGDKPVISEVEATNYLCSTSIPEVQFAKIGTWQLKVTLYNNGKKAEVTTDVTVN